MNPELHPDPHSFKPERYLEHTASAADYINVNDPYTRDHFTYGAGRRVCPGVHVAENSLYINIARTLWGFDIRKKKASDGSLVEPNQAMVRGFLSVPEQFECDIRVRSAKHEQVIRASWEAAEAAGIQR